MATPFEETSSEFILLKDQNWDKMIVTWNTVPTNATTGYAKSCQFIDSDAPAGTAALYLNKGTNTSCQFTLVTQA